MRSRGLSPILLLLLSTACSGGGLGALRRGDRHVAVPVIQRAAESDDPRLVPPLIGFLERRVSGEEGPDLYFQVLAAIRAVGDREDRPAVPVLLRLLDDPDPYLRLQVVESLALIGGAEAEAAVRRVADEDSDRRVRMRATIESSPERGVKE